MRLKTRVTLLVLAASVPLLLVLGALSWWRDQALSRRYDELLLQSQRVAWQRLQAAAQVQLQEAVRQLVEQPAWTAAWRVQDRATLDRLTSAALLNHPGWRVDVFDATRQLAYSSSVDLRPQPLLDAGGVARVQSSVTSQAGLSQVSRTEFFWVVAHGFGEADSRGVAAMGFDAARLLPELAAGLGGQSFLLNLRGREVAGTQAGLVQQLDTPLSARRAGVVEVGLPPASRALAVVEPLAGTDHRTLGALLLVKDVTLERARDQRVLLLLSAAAALATLGMGGALLAYLRRALRPLERSVKVLGKLARGDLRSALDEEDQQLGDEAGQIARGIESLRGEMLNLQMLRDERARTRRQQERLIRRQLKGLAESLDDASRAEIVAALEPSAARPGGDEAGENELVQLAGTLGRLSGLITQQQSRLVGLLKELRDAMAQQAMLLALQQELEIARKLQASILPRQKPDTPAVEIAALMIPAKEVGGDFYDYFLIDPNRLAVVVADVSGKGVPAAFFMAISRTLLKSNAMFLREPGAVIEQLNEQLCAENEQMMFVTAFFGVLDLTTGMLEFVNAGHNPPLIRQAGGSVEMLRGSQHTALAVMEGLHYAADQRRLQPGDTLVLYTDGVTEATNAQQELFGDERLLQAVRTHADVELPLHAILQAVRAFEQGAAQADDITCVAVRFRGETVDAALTANAVAPIM